MKKISTLLFLYISFITQAQTWNLPARNPSAMNGTQFVAAITNLGFAARENLIEQEILAGNVPSFYRNLVPVTSTATISGIPQSLTYYVTPDYLAVGTDTNYFLCPMSPIIATHIGDATGTTLPTRKMVNDIYAAATVKLTPQPIPASGQMTTVPVFDDHNDSVRLQRYNANWISHPQGELTGGDKKDVIISNVIYNTANRVIIYGWHQSVGNPIQPLSNVHSDTYMDYSHGIRLVQNSITYNGNPTTVQAVLQSSTLNTLLSDEGVIGTPNYPYSTAVTSLATPTSFGIKNNGNGTLSILVSNDNNATHYNVYTSNNGSSFGSPQTLVKTNLTLSSLTLGQIYFIKVAAYNQPNSITSNTSEILAAIPNNWNDSILIVNGFDRASAGNTYDFVIEHGFSINNAGYGFSSCTNEAIVNNLFSLNDYKAVDWISGEESSANESFSSAEQTKLSTFLNQGGYLLCSGSEIGWDLDHLGSSGDKAFYNDYLKASYINDAPNGQAATWYACIENPSGIFNISGTLNFDNGTNGNYNVDYPDVIDTINGSIPALFYTNNGSDIAGLSFKGMFPAASDTGKLVYLAFPFETIYPAANRDSAMNQVLNFFFKETQNTTFLKEFTNNNLEVYPNPVSSTFKIKSPTSKPLESIKMIDQFGRIVLNLNNKTSNETINITDYAAGLYYLICISDGRTITLKIIKE